MANEALREFEKRFQQEINDTMGRGMYPDSPFWYLQRLNMMDEISKDLKIELNFSQADAYTMRLQKLRRFRMFRNYNLLMFLTKIYYLKYMFKRYHVLDGLKFWVRGGGDKMHDILKNYQLLKEYEPETTKIVKANIKPGDICVDIGASIGYFSMQFSRATGPTGKVIAIEPTDFQQPFLKKNAKLNKFKNIQQFMVGAWDKEEVIKMPRNAPEYVQTELLCRPVDNILEELGIMEVDFMKIDTDGAEPWVLKGLERTFERSKNLKMIFEYYPKYVKDAGGDMKDVDRILDKYFTYDTVPGDYTDGCWNYFCKRR